jgi:protein TonB
VRLPAPAAFAISGALHAGAFLALVRAPALVRPAPETVQVEVVEVAPAPPPPPAPAEPPAPVPAPRRPPPRVRPAPPPRAAQPASPPEAPPPPNAPPPDEAPPPEKAPVRIGISMSSATTSGGVAAPAGNTLYGELPSTAPAPGEARPYRAERYVPPTQVTALPRAEPQCFETSADDYPEEAERLQLEGRVRLSLTIDERGAIAEAKVVEDPGHGFGAAAIAALRRHGCRFSPPRRGADAVTTRIPFTYRFTLP